MRARIGLSPPERRIGQSGHDFVQTLGADDVVVTRAKKRNGSPMVPSRYGNRYAYGHVVEEDRHLIVSGGLGCSILPVRLGVPPEIVMVDVAAA